MTSAARAAPSGEEPAAIVVLGAKVLPDGRPSRALQRRMQLGIALYRAGVAPALLLSGGGCHTVSEAEAMRRLALAAGVPESALLLEPESRNTLENATETARLLRDSGITGVILVTDRYHAVRAHLLFRLAGVAVLGVRAAPMSRRQQVTMLITESIKLPISIVSVLLHKAARARHGRGG